MHYINKIFLGILLCTSFLFISCNDDDAQNSSNALNISFDSPTLGDGRPEEDLNPAKVVLSIADLEGIEVLSDEELQVNSFNNGYLVDPILLGVGDYQITKFLVLNELDEIILATPLEGSLLAGLVQNPLPVQFQILSDQVTDVSLEVVSTEGLDPEDLGYSSINFNIVPTIDILVSVLKPDAERTNFVLSSATLNVKNGTSDLFSQQLGDSINVVKLRTDVDTYTFEVVLSNGQKLSKEVLSDELNNFRTRPLEFVFRPRTNSGLFGIIDNNLVQIDSVTGKAELFVEITDLPANLDNFRSITYDVENELFYAVINGTTNAALVSIDFSGSLLVIGNLTLQGNQLELVEGIAYDNDSEVLYISASLNGGVNQNDFYAESILTVNPQTAATQFVTEMVTPVGFTPDDIDEMTIKNGVLYMMDSQPPGANFLSLFNIELSNLNQGSSTIANGIYSTTHISGSTIAVSGDRLYYGAIRELYRYNISSGSFDSVGPTHSETEFNEKTLRGLVYIDRPLSF